MSSSKEYRRKAAEAYRMAEVTASERARAKLLEVAKSWDHVATQAERLDAQKGDVRAA
jgi:hypothetical protein